MNLDFEKIIVELGSKANKIYEDRDKLWVLLSKTKKKLEGNKELSSLFDDIKIIIELVKDYAKGEYKSLAKSSVILVIISLIYLVNPLDLIPDFLFGGFVDDAAVIAYIIKKIATEIDSYKLWRNSKVTAKMNDEDIIDLDDNMIDITLDKEE